MLSTLSNLYLLKAGGVFAAIMLLAMMGRTHHPFARFGPANWVTTLRALLVALVAGLIGDTPSPALAVVAVAGGGAATALDGVDGWLARRTGMTSAFGARFDMEVDALLILVLAALTWQYEKAGAWVLLSGLLRYGFVAAGRIWPWMRRPLAPSARGKTICVVQIAGLLIALAPPIAPPLSSAVAGISLAALGYSFAVDTWWLWTRRDRETAPPMHDLSSASSGSSASSAVTLCIAAARRWVTMLAGLALLNAAVTFDNVWPTPAVRWSGAFSVELAFVLLALLALWRWRGRPATSTLAWLSALWMVLVVGRYADVTAPALYGRDINLYWDLRFIPDVTAMVTRVAPVWLVVVAVTTALLLLALLHRLFRWSFSRVVDGFEDTAQRRLLMALAAAGIVLFAVRGETNAGGDSDLRRSFPSFTRPVVRTYAHQAALVVQARGGSAAIPEGPPIESTFADVAGADVFLVFVESYGAVADTPRFAAPLTESRHRFAADIHDSGRQVVSAYVESPTFGGSSWLAHLSLISGVEVRDARTNALLMTQPRDTLVTAFKRHGFRTIGLMPGLRRQWPEGRFYGFDEIYGADRLAYTGPEFGWFALPDQFSLARFDQLEADRPPGARFVFFPTISTHFPFGPTPPYQPDWPRMLAARPYDGPAIVDAYAKEPNWIDFAPGYVDALTYDFAVLGGYLRRHADRDVILIALGDHQPPAAVSGLGASWNVPVHVVTSHAAILDRLIARGFTRGVQPSGVAVGKMHELLRMLVDAFGPID